MKQKKKPVFSSKAPSKLHPPMMLKLARKESKVTVWADVMGEPR
jgi:hypothetical protein